MAKFGYEITAKDRSRPAIEQAKQGIASMGAPLAKLQGLLTTAFATGGIAVAAKKIYDLGAQFADAAREAEKVVIQFNQAMAMNANMTREGADRLSEYANQMQRATGVSDDLVREQLSFLGTMGLNEKQMRRVMDAALDLSSTGMVNLETAVRSLGGSFEGNVGMLGRYVPSLRDLTKEQLEAGGAVDLVAAKFRDMAKVIGETSTGVANIWKETWGDQGEKIGAPIAEGVRRSQLSLMPLIDTVGDIGLGVVVGLQRAGEAIVWWMGFQYKAFGGFMGRLFDLTATVAKILWLPIEIAFAKPIHAIEVAFVAMINFLLDKAEAAFNWLGEKFQKISGGLVGGGMAGLKIGRLGTPAAPAEKRDLIGEAKALVMGFVNRTATWGTDMVDELKKGLDVFRPVADHTKSAVDAIWAAVDGMGDVAEGLQYAQESMAAMAGMAYGQQVAAATTGYEGFGGAGLGQAGGTAAGTDMSGFLQILNGLFGELGQATPALAGLTTGITAASAWLLVLIPIFKGMMAILQPFIDAILTPIIGILTILGNTIGKILIPVFQFLTPIIELVGKAFVWFYNKIIVPVGNLLMWIFTTLGNVFIGIANAIIWVINLFLSKRKELAYLDYLKYTTLEAISLEDINTAGSAAVATVTEAAAAASYTAGRTVNANINIYTDVISGEGGFRQLAIMLRDEILSLEALGV